jgi:hypothetical protein
MEKIDFIKALSEKDPERQSDQYDAGLKQMKEWVLEIISRD